MNTKEGNKLIAQFMGIQIGKDLYSWRIGCTEPIKEEHLNYHKEWGWIMQVVEKIAIEHSLFRLTIGNVNSVCHFEDSDLRKTIEPKPIDAVWKQVINFIQWYNQNK